MKQHKGIVLVLVCLGFSLSIISQSLQAQTEDTIDYQIIERSRYAIHAVTIPHNGSYQVKPVITGDLQPISDFVGANTVAAINGGYFDPVNQKTTSFMVERSQIVADPRFNERLVDNPDLKPYLRKIFNRAEFRRYSCGEVTRYDIQLHFAPIPNDCTLIASLGGGPGLLPKNSSVAEGFVAYQNGEKIRDAIGNDSLNARSAVGITKEGNVILVMVAQDPNKPLDSGISLPDLAAEMSSLGAVKAMNLDGGSSASLYYGDPEGERRFAPALRSNFAPLGCCERNRTIFGRVDREGKPVIRPIKSALIVIPANN